MRTNLGPTTRGRLKYQPRITSDAHSEMDNIRERRSHSTTNKIYYHHHQHHHNYYLPRHQSTTAHSQSCCSFTGLILIAFIFVIAYCFVFSAMMSWSRHWNDASSPNPPLGGYDHDELDQMLRDRRHSPLDNGLNLKRDPLPKMKGVAARR